MRSFIIQSACFFLLISPAYSQTEIPADFAYTQYIDCVNDQTIFTSYSGQYLSVDGWNLGGKRILITFEASSLPSEFNSAKLRIFAKTEEAGSLPVMVLPDENSLWEVEVNKPFWYTGLHAIPFAPDLTWLEFDITDAIIAAMASGTPLISVRLYWPRGSEGMKLTMYSEGDASLAPRLVFDTVVSTESNSFGSLKGQYR